MPPFVFVLLALVLLLAVAGAAAYLDARSHTRRRPSSFVTFADPTKTKSDPQPTPEGQAAVASASSRVIRGLAAPYGIAGRAAMGRIRFGNGRLTFSDPAAGRIPLLLEHDRTAPIGVVTELAEGEYEGVTGLVFAARVDDGPAGDAVLATFASGSRTGISVGVDLDDDSLARLTRSNGRSVVDVAGGVREISVTTIPVFDDARASAPGVDVEAAVRASAGYVVPASAPFDDARGRILTATPPGMLVCTVPPADDSAPTTGPAQQDPPAQPTQGAASQATHSAPAPAPRAGRLPGAPGLLTHSNPYADGQHSVILDLVAAREQGDRLAAQRIADLQAGARELVGTPAGELARFAVDTIAGDVGDHGIPEDYRAQLLVRAIDPGRPITSRMTQRVPLSSSTPMRVPVEGEFTDAAGTGDGVAVHTEGTSHAAEGALTMNEIPVSPRAVSGAYRFSRELLDATGQAALAVDALAVAAMRRNYTKNSELYTLARLNAATGAATDVTDTDGLIEAMFDVADALDDDDQGLFVAIGKGLFREIALEKLSNGEPRFPTIGATNREGSSARLNRLDLRGVEGVKASRVADREAYIVHPSSYLHGEGPLLTFRFEEVEGPGIIKVALWAYQAGQVTRTAGVDRVTIPAA